MVLLFGERTNYLTADGVIDPALMPAGELTRSMCSPWQFDFTDCGCYLLGVEQARPGFQR